MLKQTVNTDTSVTTFGLIRHGTTIWNEKKKIQGHKNSPLTPKGISLARQWGMDLKKISWDLIIASDLGRAMETAQYINEALNVPIISDHKLIEQDFGSWAGKTIQQIIAISSDMLLSQQEAGWNFCPPNGEKRSSIWKRSSKALINAHGKWPNSKILVISHEGVIKSLIYKLSGRLFLPSEPALLKERYLHFIKCNWKGLQIKQINAVKLATAN